MSGDAHPKDDHSKDAHPKDDHGKKGGSPGAKIWKATGMVLVVLVGLIVLVNIGSSLGIQVMISVNNGLKQLLALGADLIIIIGNGLVAILRAIAMLFSKVLVTIIPWVIFGAIIYYIFLEIKKEIKKAKGGGDAGHH